MTPEQLAKNGTEDGHQAALFCKAAQNQDKYPELKWLHAIPNGGQRNKITASRMKATGTRAGVLDIFLPVPVQVPHDELTSEVVQYHGLYIEMKKPSLAGHKNGGMSPKQVEFKAHATFFGYSVVTCYTWEEAWLTLETYLMFVPMVRREQYRILMEQYR